MLRAIREIAPKWIVGENVFGLTNWNGGLVFEEVCADLEAEGYEVQPFVLPAASVNAPHRRDRVWFVAYSHLYNDRRTTREDESESGKERVQKWDTVRESSQSGEIFGASSDPESGGTREQQTENKGRKDRRLNDDGAAQNATDTSGKGLQGGKEQRGIKGSGSKRDEQPARFIQSIWENFPTQPPICSGNDGLPTELDGITFPKWRNESIKAYGNAVVPQVVYQIFKAIQAYENE